MELFYSGLPISHSTSKSHGSKTNDPQRIQQNNRETYIRIPLKRILELGSR